MANEYASIPEPTEDVKSLLECVQALKQTVEALIGQRGTDTSTVVTKTALAAKDNLAGCTPSVALQNLGLPSNASASTWFQVANNLSEGVAATIRSNIVAATKSQTDFISGIIKAPVNQDYRIIEYLPYGVTLTKFRAKTSSGTCTATLKLNTTAVTNGAINVTSTQGNNTPSAANVGATGDALVMTISANASAVDLSFEIEFTYTLA